MNRAAKTSARAPSHEPLSDAELEMFCELGAKADLAVAENRFRDALPLYRKVIAAVEKSGHLDSYLLAKVTLGTLRCHVKLAEFQDAISIWNAEIDGPAEESVYGIGIYALENAQTKIEDLLVYDMICAFLHTVVESEREPAAKAVNLYMSRVCEHAADNGERALMIQVLANWKAHLREIFGGSIPHGAATTLIRFEKAFGETVKPRSIDFPLPAPWERPSHFRETSTIISRRALKERAKKK